MRKKIKSYEIQTLLDFTKVPRNKLNRCLLEFNDWVQMMQRAKKTNTLIPIDKFIWLDDGQRNVTIKIVTSKAK